jgi:hypothetical protein
MIDIIDKKCNLLNPLSISNKYNLDIMSANSIFSCVPKNWKQRLKDQTVVNTDTNSYFYLGKTKKNVISVKCRDVYWYLISEITQLPSCINKWHNKLGRELHINSWRYFFLNIKNMSFKQYYQMLQYKICHRLINVKEYLYKCKLEPDDSCKYCNEQELIEHAFFYCNYNTIFY